MFLQNPIVSPEAEELKTIEELVEELCWSFTYLSDHCSSSWVCKLLVKLMEGIRLLQKSDPKLCKLSKEPSRASQGTLGTSRNTKSSSEESRVHGGKQLHPFRIQSCKSLHLSFGRKKPLQTHSCLLKSFHRGKKCCYLQGEKSLGLVCFLL